MTKENNGFYGKSNSDQYFLHFVNFNGKGLSLSTEELQFMAEDLKQIRVFKNGLSKIWGIQPLKNLKWYYLLQ